MEVHFDFERLSVYQKSLDFIDKAYQTIKKFPKEEIFDLGSQFRRAATSICLNIAEGSAGTKPEFRRFLKISLRSVRECVAIIEVASGQDYITQEEKQALREDCAEMAKMLTGLIKSVQKH